MNHERSSRRVLFTPWGNGNGHVMRAVALAESARDDGWEPIVAVMDEGQQALAENRGVSTVRYADASPGIDPWTAWTDASFWLNAVGHDRLLLRRTGASLVVVDSRLSMQLAAHLEGVELTGVVQDMDFPGYLYPGRPREELWDDLDGVLRHVFRAHRMDYDLDDPRRLIVSGGVVVPGTPESDDVPEEHRAAVTYTGPVTGYTDAVRDPELVPPADALLFYKTVQPGSDLRAFGDAFGDLFDRICVATGDPRSADQLSEHFAGTGVKVRSLWDIGAEGAGPAVAVIHGGHGTILHMVQAGVPALVVPDLSPERYANAVKADAIASMSGVVDGIDPAALTWAAQKDAAGVVGFAAVRHALDRMDMSQATRAAARLAESYRGYTITAAWASVRDSARVPGLERSTSVPGGRPAGEL